MAAFHQERDDSFTKEAKKAMDRVITEFTKFVSSEHGENEVFSMEPGKICVCTVYLFEYK
jgi:hypothetical protein